MSLVTERLLRIFETRICSKDFDAGLAVLKPFLKHGYKKRFKTRIKNVLKHNPLKVSVFVHNNWVAVKNIELFGCCCVVLIDKV